MENLPSELLNGCQFRGVMPELSSKVNERDSDLFSKRKEKDKMKFDTKSKQLQELFIGSNVAYLSTDLKSWSIGKVHARCHDDCTHQSLTENGILISRNNVHLRPTRLEAVPIDKFVKPCISNVKTNKPIITIAGNTPQLMLPKLVKPLLKTLPYPMMICIELDLEE